MRHIIKSALIAAVSLPSITALGAIMPAAAYNYCGEGLVDLGQGCLTNPQFKYIGHYERFGALAWGQDKEDGKWRYVFTTDRQSGREAVNSVMTGCAKNYTNCQLAGSSPSGYGAIVIGDDSSSIHGSFAKKKSKAREDALKSCAALAKDCKVEKEFKIEAEPYEYWGYYYMPN